MSNAELVPSCAFCAVHEAVLCSSVAALLDQARAAGLTDRQEAPAVLANHPSTAKIAARRVPMMTTLPTIAGQLPRTELRLMAL